MNKKIETEINIEIDNVCNSILNSKNTYNDILSDMTKSINSTEKLRSEMLSNNDLDISLKQSFVNKADELIKSGKEYIIFLENQIKALDDKIELLNSKKCIRKVNYE